MSEVATFGAGCFWQVEVAFRNTEGVTDAAVGYMGGTVENPTYRQVCTGDTGHAEVCQVTFEPDTVAYEQLVKIFFSLHDPTQVDRQGPDVGTQYRSVIFVHSDAQKDAAIRVRDEIEREGRYRAPIATQVEPAGVFYPAEDYHQRYLEKRGLAVCRI